MGPVIDFDSRAVVSLPPDGRHGGDMRSGVTC